MPPDRIRVVVADDHPIFRLGVRTLLADDAEVELIGEAKDGEEALQLVAGARPDVLLLDLNLPVLNGLDVLRRLQATDTQTRTVLLSASVEPGDVRTAIQRGARGVLLKHTASELLGRCIRQVARGEYWVAPDGVSALVDALRMPAATDAGAALTARETEIVTGVVRGASNKEIAAALNIGEQTVKNHLRNIFEKLRVANRVELALRAVERRLVDPPSS